MKKRVFTSQQGSSLLVVVAIIAVLTGVGLAGWYIWSKNHKANNIPKSTNSVQEAEKDAPAVEQKDETQAWTPITTQDKAFTMRVPDGWKMTSYPGDFIGAMDVGFMPGTPATVDSEDTEYMGHALRFRANVTNLDDAGLEQQWESPQPGLHESVEDFYVGRLKGKRFKGSFTGDIKQTLYEYVFDVGNGKKLDIVYTVYYDQGEEDKVAVAEKAIKTIQLEGWR